MKHIVPRFAILTILLLIGAQASFAQHNFLVHAKDGQLGAALSSIEAAGGEVVRTIDQINLAIVRSSNEQFPAALNGMAGVDFLTDNPTIQWLDPAMEPVLVEESFDNPPNSGDDDFFFDLQWGHDAVDAVEMWNTGYRGAGVKVAVLDSGIDCTHPDIVPNLLLAKSASFVPGEDVCVATGFTYFNHGTHVAGTVLAADNGVGVIGVAPHAKLIAVKVLSEFTGSGAFDWIIAGIVHAADQGADIINMSLRGLFVKAGRFDGIQKEARAAIELATAYATAKGTLVIAAAGNDALNIDSIYSVLPAHADHVLSIAAAAPVNWGVDPTTNLDVPASYTNYGKKSVDFAGPGGDFDSGNFNLCTVGGVTNVCVAFDGVLSASPGPAWFWASGTSMATPHAAGVAALLKSQFPGASPYGLRNLMKNRADKLGTNPGNDDFFGWGRVDAINGATGAAGDLATDRPVFSIDGEIPESFFVDQNYPNPFNPTTAIAFGLPEQATARVSVYDLLGREVAVLLDGVLDAGRHEVLFDAQNLPSGAYFYRIEAGSFVEMKQMLLLK